MFYMLQRIQTVYLALVFILNGILSFVLPIGYTSENVKFHAAMNPLYAGIFALTTALAVVSIFSYKNRKNQFVINRLNMISNVILLGLFVYQSLNLSGESQLSEKGIGMLLPILSIVALVFANRAIKKDEELVKSVDRLR